MIKELMRKGKIVGRKKKKSGRYKEGRRECPTQWALLCKVSLRSSKMATNSYMERLPIATISSRGVG